MRGTKRSEVRNNFKNGIYHTGSGEQKMIWLTYCPPTLKIGSDKPQKTICHASRKIRTNTVALAVEPNARAKY